MNFGFLDELEQTQKQNNTPTDMEALLFLFFEKGITLKEFCELPIPYIMGIVKAQIHRNKEEEKAYKKAKRK